MQTATALDHVLINDSIAVLPDDTRDKFVLTIRTDDENYEDQNLILRERSWSLQNAIIVESMIYWLNLYHDEIKTVRLTYHSYQNARHYLQICFDFGIEHRYGFIVDCNYDPASLIELAYLISTSDSLRKMVFDIAPPVEPMCTKNIETFYDYLQNNPPEDLRSLKIDVGFIDLDTFAFTDGRFFESLTLTNNFNARPMSIKRTAYFAASMTTMSKLDKIKLKLLSFADSSASDYLFRAIKPCKRLIIINRENQDLQSSLKNYFMSPTTEIFEYKREQDSVSVEPTTSPLNTVDQNNVMAIVTTLMGENINFGRDNSRQAAYIKLKKKQSRLREMHFPQACVINIHDMLAAILFDSSSFFALVNSNHYITSITGLNVKRSCHQNCVLENCRSPRIVDHIDIIEQCLLIHKESNTSTQIRRSKILLALNYHDCGVARELREKFETFIDAISFRGIEETKKGEYKDQINFCFMMMKQIGVEHICRLTTSSRKRIREN